MISDSVGAGHSRGVGDCLALVGFVEFGQFFVGAAHADAFQTGQTYRLQVAVLQAPVRKKWSGLFVHCVSSQGEERDARRFRWPDFMKLIGWLGSVLPGCGDEISPSRI